MCRTGSDLPRSSERPGSLRDDARVGAVRAVCSIGYPDILTELWAALEGTRTVTIAPNGYLVIEGGGHRAVLRAEGAVSPLSLAGEWRVGAIDGETDRPEQSLGVER